MGNLFGGHKNPITETVGALVPDIITGIVSPDALPFVIGGQGLGAAGAAAAGSNPALGATLGGAVAGLGSGLFTGPPIPPGETPVSAGLDFGQGTTLTSGLPQGQAVLGAGTPVSSGLDFGPGTTLTSSFAPSLAAVSGGLNFGPGTSLTSTLPGISGLPAQGGGLTSGQQAFFGLQALNSLSRMLAPTIPAAFPSGGAFPGGVTPQQFAALSAAQSSPHTGLAPWYLNRMRGMNLGQGGLGSVGDQSSMMNMMQQNHGFV